VTDRQTQKEKEGAKAELIRRPARPEAADPSVEPLPQSIRSGFTQSLRVRFEHGVKPCP